MRLFECMSRRPRHIFAATLASLLVACGGSGGQDPILGIPSVATTPRVIWTHPAKSSPILTDVVINTALAAKFSQSMNAATLTEASFKVACPLGSPFVSTITYDSVNRIATLQHATVFPQSTICEATITTAAKDTAGAPLEKDYSWQFTTGIRTDSSAPTVLANNPVNLATGICMTQKVNVTFSEAMDSSTINSSTFTVSNLAGDLMPGHVTYDPRSHTATLMLADSISYEVDTVYTSTVTTGAKDLAGHPLTSANITSFRTGAQACTPAEAINLGTMSTYGVFGGGAGVTNSGIDTLIEGDLGTTAVCTAIVGFHDSANIYTEDTSSVGDVTGNIYCAPPAPGTLEKLGIATRAAADARTAYNDLAGKATTGDLGLVAGELGLAVVPPGVYKPSLSSADITSGDLTLDAQGNPDAVWIFQVASALTVGAIGAPRSVLLINGAQAKNVFWQVGSAARIGNSSAMVGTIIARAGVTMSTAGQTIATTLLGRAIGLDASVTMVNATITVP